MDGRNVCRMLILMACCLLLAVQGAAQKAVVIEVGHEQTWLRIYTWDPNNLYYGIPSDLKVEHTYKFRKLERKVLLDYNSLLKFIKGLLREVQNDLPYPQEEKADTYFIMRPYVFDYDEFPEANVIKLLKEVAPEFNLKFKLVNYLAPDADATEQWTALNYLRGSFFSGGPALAGFLELNTRQQSHACLYTEWHTYGATTVGTRTFDLFFPHDVDLKLLKRRLLEKLKNKSNIIHDPCALQGYTDTATVLGDTVTVIGRPNFEDCDRLIDYYVKPDTYSSSYKFTGDLRYKQNIYMLGELQKSVEYTKVAKPNDRFSPSKLEEVTRAFCSMTLEVAGKSTRYQSTTKAISDFCLINHYGLKLILKRLKISRNNKNLIYVPDFDGQLPDRGMGTILQSMCEKDKCNPSSSGKLLYSFPVILSGLLLAFTLY